MLQIPFTFARTSVAFFTILSFFLFLDCPCCSYHLLSISTCQTFPLGAQYLIEHSNSSGYYSYSWLGQSLINKWHIGWGSSQKGGSSKFPGTCGFLCLQQTGGQHDLGKRHAGAGFGREITPKTGMQEQEKGFQWPCSSATTIRLFCLGPILCVSMRYLG